MAAPSPSVADALSSPLLATVVLVALTSPFVVSGLTKLMDFRGAVDEVRALTGVKGSGGASLAALVILVQLGGSVLLLSGRPWGVTGGAALLAGFTGVATMLAHAWWHLKGPERIRALTVFSEHVALCGGLALAVVLVWQT